MAAGWSAAMADQVETSVVPESLRYALIAMHRYGRPEVPYGTRALYQPVMSPSTAHALARRGWGLVTSGQNSRFGYRGGSIRFTDAGRELAARLDREARDREIERINALELSPPQRGHLRVVRDDPPPPPASPAGNQCVDTSMYCTYCYRRIHQQRDDTWYHNHNASTACKPGWTTTRATPGTWRPL
jgi:hypothetical protein